MQGAPSRLECINCHMTEGNHLMKVLRPEDVAGTTRKDTCTSCHSKSSSESRAVYLEMWQQSVGDRLTALQNDITKIDAALKANPNALSKELMDKYAAAKTNFTFVQAGGSKGVHNFEYAIKILTESRKTVDDVLKVVR